MTCIDHKKRKPYKTTKKLTGIQETLKELLFYREDNYNNFEVTERINLTLDLFIGKLTC
jgi:hypothetical protein